uniref:Uncharacterized protein n=1 Tax=Marmota marmota marmota TaxID=9994 RepID=A0A8C6ABW1_MARMA
QKTFPSSKAVSVRSFDHGEKNFGSKCVVSMHSRTTLTVQDPKNPEHVKSFTFDLAYWLSPSGHGPLSPLNTCSLFYSRRVSLLICMDFPK